MRRNEVDRERRRFLKISMIAGAGLVATYHSVPLGRRRQALASPDVKPEGAFAPNAWLRIDSDDTITVMVNHSEMGQGITTALPMIVAEELEADWRKVRFEIAPVADVYKHPDYGIQWTVSSKSVESSWDLLREAGAKVRALFILAAAGTWQVPIGELRAENSRVIHEPTGRVLRYGELIEKASGMPVPESVRLKSPGQFKILGKPVHRLDGREKTNGSAKFGTDIRIPEMLTATVVHPPVFGSRIASLNEPHLLGLKGVKRVFPIETGVAIVADTFWQAKKAKDTLKVQWKDHENGNIDSVQLFERWAEMGKHNGKTFFEQGNIDGIFKSGGPVLESAYDLPYQAHATPEPMNCTADVREDTCEIWVPTQNQKGAQEIAARITGLDNADIKVHTTYLGGGFGRRALVDYVGEAVQISKEMKTPVKVIWTREEDFLRDHLRPATHNVMKAVIDKRGKPVAWLHRIVGADVFGQTLPKIITAKMPDAVPFCQECRRVSGGKSHAPFCFGEKGDRGSGPPPLRL